jgi:hypothetical protein
MQMKPKYTYFENNNSKIVLHYLNNENDNCRNLNMVNKIDVFLSLKRNHV